MRYAIFLLFFIIQSAFAETTPSIDAIVPPVLVTPQKQIEHSITQGQRRTITRQEMTQLGATSLSQALQEMGGVQLQDTTGNGSQVMLSMRGFGVNASSNTLLMINGIPITNPDLAPPDLNAIPLQEIEYIEITSGTETVLYGDQAVGGTINIVTHKSLQDQFDLVCSGGNFNNTSCYTALNKRIKQLDINIGASTSHTDNYREHNDYNQNLMSGSINYPYSTGKFTLDYQFANERMLYPGALTAKQVRQNRRQASNTSDFFKDWNGFYHLKNQQSLTSNWQLETNLARREMHGDGILMLPFNQSRIIHFAKPQLKGQFDKLTTITGIDFENDHYYLSSLYGVTDDSQQKYSLFSIANIALNSALECSVGARGAQQNNRLLNTLTTRSNNKALATTLGLAYQIAPHTQVYLRRAESFRFPKADEDASTPIGVNGLKTQRGVSYETGGTWAWHKITTKIGFYQLNLRDEITFDPFQTIQQPFGANRNLAPTIRRGLSVSEKCPLTNKLLFDSQYNYVNAEFQKGRNAGNRIPLVSEHIFHIGTLYRFATHWNLYTEALYTGNQFAANDDANITGKIGGYTVFNLNLRYHVKTISGAFRVNNIFNKYYYFYSVYQAPMDTEFYYPAPGRNFLFTLKYTFV